MYDGEPKSGDVAVSKYDAAYRSSLQSRAAARRCHATIRFRD